MAYVDGFVVPVPRDRLEGYKQMARSVEGVRRTRLCRVHRRRRAAGQAHVLPPGSAAQGRRGVVLSWIVYDSREQRDAINAKVMADPRMKEWEARMPFDGKRMFWGGFVPFLGL